MRKLAEMRSDFVSTVTHELKTPIATIRAAAETWSQDRLSGIDTLSSHTAGLVVGEAKRLSRLVENLLAYARITDIAAGATRSSPSPVGILFNDIQQEFEAQLDEAGFDLQINLAAGHRASSRRPAGVAPAVRQPHRQFDPVFQSGAARPPDRGKHQWSTVTIHVSDSGIGIPPEEIPLGDAEVRERAPCPSRRQRSGIGNCNAESRATITAELSIRSTPGEGNNGQRLHLPAA